MKRVEPIDGHDVGDSGPSDSTPSCRVCTESSGETSGVPAVETTAAALEGGRRPGWRGLLSVFPGIGASLLPVGVCPACWPAYAGLLSALGLGFLLENRFVPRLRPGDRHLSYAGRMTGESP